MFNRKRLTVCILSFICLLAVSGRALAQSTKATDSTKKILNKLLQSKKSQDTVTVNEDLKHLSASENENEVFLAAEFYYQLKNQRAADSLNNLRPAKFPKGYAARDKAARAIYKLKTPEEMDAAYQKLIQEFPPSNFPDVDYDHINYDYVVSATAERYALAHNYEKAKYFIGFEEEEFWKTNGYDGLANAFAKAGDTTDAEIYTKKALDIAAKYYYAKNNDDAGKFAASGYPGILTSYAIFLYSEGKNKEALSYIEKAHKLDTKLEPFTNYKYAQVLMTLHRNREAFKVLEDVVKAGKANPEMEGTFKNLYIKTHKGDKGYEAYSAMIRQGYLVDLNKRLNKEIMNVPAAGFTLTDLDGNKVSLADYKGKIVILDFWATWCGPCKASFPAMQMAKNKFENDPDVKFLFIHTWERGTETPTEDARAYIKSKGYNFQVLMDLKDPATKQNKVVTSYGVNGIPSKFVIDKNGIIRFHLLGFDGSNEAAVDELSMMIEMAKKHS